MSKQGQKLVWWRRTILTVAAPELVGSVCAIRSGGSPSKVLVTANADFDMDERL